MINTVTRILCVTGLLITSSACTKMAAKKLEGTYAGTFTSSHWTLGNGVEENSGTTSFTVTRAGDNVMISGSWLVPVKELKDGAEYSEGTSNYKSVSFKDGEMSYTEKHTAGGGGSTYYFWGQKEH